MIGSKRLHIVFEIPEYKFEYMGKAGGRQGNLENFIILWKVIVECDIII